MKREPSFSLHDFRNWINKNADSKIIIVGDNGLHPGDKVNIRLSEKNMIKKIKPLNESFSDEEMIKISKDLRENGAILKNIEGPNALVRVLGSEDEVYIQRLFLRRPKK